MTRAQEDAVEIVAKSFGWDQRSVADLGLMLWCLFRYFAKRAAMSAGKSGGEDAVVDDKRGEDTPV